jgi:hypothetical protein
MNKQEIEKKLVPRLKFIGFILLAFCLITVAYSFIPLQEELEIEEAIIAEIEETSLAPLNPYTIAIAFGIVGAACVTIAWRKKSAEANTDRG